MKPTKEMVHSKTSKTNEAATVFLLLVLVLAFSLTREPMSSVSAEPDQGMLHVETTTSYHYQTEGDAISHVVELAGERWESSELRNFDSKRVKGLKLTFEAHLPVEWADAWTWGAGWVGGTPYYHSVSDSTYLWLFYDLLPDQKATACACFVPPISFTPDFSAKRVVTPTKLTYPGGTQTITVSVTPQESEFITFDVRVGEDDNIEATIASVIWPSMSEGGTLHGSSQTDERVECAINKPTIDATYTLVVAINIELKEGIKAVEYKPYVGVGRLVFLPPFKTIDGKSATSETDAGTWKWETTSQHTWICWNSIGKAVEFLAYSHALQPIEATVDLNPNTLYLKSKGKFVTCYIELPNDYDSEDIDLGTAAITKINGKSEGLPLYTVGPSEIGDYDSDGVPDLMVNFDRQALLRLLEAGEARLTVEGYLKDATPFEGTDTIRVIGE